MSPFPVLFVCLGNICRSPLAEGIFRHLTALGGQEERYPTDSAGTGGWHIGHAPDQRSIEVARMNGIDIAGLRARRVAPEDFRRFGLILAMDHDNLRNLKTMAPPDATARVALFSAFSTGKEADVPDPYYGGIDGFQAVYTMLFAGCTSLVEKLESGSWSGNTSSVR